MKKRISNLLFISFSDQEIIEMHEQGKEGKYSEKVTENGVMVNRAIPFDAVRDEIYNELEKKAKYRRAQDWKNE